MSEQATKAVTPEKYRGWKVTWDYGQFTAVSPDYDVSYEGPENGWVDNGLRTSAPTFEALCIEVDEILSSIEEQQS